MQTKLTNAIDVIKDTYDYETCKEIVNHGCQSGVCSEHIYYADTLGFFEEYEGDITEFVVDSAGSDFVGELLSQHGGDLDAYKNDMTWAFIEFVAMDVVDNYNDEEYVPDYTLADSIVDDVLQSGYNPPGCMTDERYAHAG